MNRKIGALIALVLLLLAACGQKPAQKTPVEQPAQPQTETTQAPAAEAAESEIESSVADIDKLNTDLDTSSLDQMDQDLAAIDTLEIS